MPALGDKRLFEAVELPPQQARSPLDQDDQGIRRRDVVPVFNPRIELLFLAEQIDQ